MRIRITKGVRDDGIEILRDDGSIVTTRFGHKGPVPHDVTHLLVERGLGMDDGFWGKVALGAEPEDLGAMAKAAGHASAKRASVPDPDIVEIVQAERIVESFEADLWSDGADNESLRAMADAGCGQSLVPPLAMSDAAIDTIRAELRAFREQWGALGEGGQAELDWVQPVPAQ
jgi:hypothetical protein